MLYLTHNSHSMDICCTSQGRYQVVKSHRRNVKNRETETGEGLGEVPFISTYHDSSFSHFLFSLYSSLGVSEKAFLAWRGSKCPSCVPRAFPHFLSRHTSYRVAVAYLGLPCSTVNAVRTGGLHILLTDGSPGPCTWKLLNKSL